MSAEKQQQQQQQQQSVPTIATSLNQQLQRGEEQQSQQQQQQQQQQKQQPPIKFQMTITTKTTHKSSVLSKRLRPQQLDKVCIFFGELTATAMLIFLGCMGCVESSLFINSHLQCSLNFGFVVLICIQCFGCVSGAHLNPAVTLASYIYNMISLPMALAYFVAQMLGAFIGYGLLKAVLPNNAVCSAATPLGVCLTSVNSSINVWQAVLIEFLVTCVLIFVCCGVWDPRNSKFGDSIGIRFGLAVGCLSMTAGQFTGASMNPARSFGPALWNNVWEHHWIYWVGPLAAALATSVVYKHVFRRQVNDESDNSAPEKPELANELEMP